MKATGREIALFYNSLPESQYVDWEENEPELYDDSGNWNLKAEVVYDLKAFGSICSQETGAFIANFETAFRKWKKAQSVKIFVVEVPVGMELAFTNEIDSLGCKIIK